MPKDSFSVERDRILTLEINFKNFMDQVTEKLDTILENQENMEIKIDAIPLTYATKLEVDDVRQQIKGIKTEDNETSRLWIQRNWATIIALITAAWAILSNIFK